MKTPVANYRRAASEAVFQAQVIRIAKMNGWMVFHPRKIQSRDGRWLTAVQGDVGFPDLVFAHRNRGIIFAELKSSVGRLEDQQTRWLEELVLAGGEAYIYSCDLSNMEDIDRMADEVLRDFDHVDILINNAGRSIRRAVMESTTRFHDFQRTMDLNYFGAIRLIMKLLPSMTKRKSGHIVNISSIGVLANAARFSAYVASKAAVEALTKVAAKELTPSGVIVSAVGFGPIDTALTRAVPKPALAKIDAAIGRPAGTTMDQAADFLFAHMRTAEAGRVEYFGRVP